MTFPTLSRTAFAAALLFFASGVLAQTGNDVLIGSFDTVNLCLNDDAGTYACSPVAGGGAQPRDFAVGDFNRDGLNDFASANGNSNPNRICLADGTGGFDCSDVFPAQVNYTGVDTADFDGENGPDLVFSYANGPAALCLNNGAGQFACSDVNATFANDVAAADLDGVNGPDLVLTTLSFYYVCFNDGAGGFPSCQNASLPNAGNLNAVAVGDLDGMNGLDFTVAASILFGGDRGNNLACLNDGTGSFTCGDISADQDGSYDTAIGDLDGVNGPDVLFTNSDASTQLCLNDGSGSFTCEDTDGGGGFFTQIAIGNVDGQSGLDYAVGTTSAAPASTCANDGSGSFSCSALPLRGSLVQFGEFGGEVAPAPALDFSITSFTKNPERGGVVTFDGSITNNGPDAIAARAYYDITTPSGRVFRRDLVDGRLAAGRTVTLQRISRPIIRVPATIDAGMYTVTVFIAAQDGGEVLNQDSFSFTLPPQSGAKAAVTALTTPEAGPNPFTTSTTIRYALEDGAEVDLRVYDATGREVAILASGFQASGAQSATLQAGDLPSGVYVWRLTARGEVTTGRVTLAR